VSADASWSNLQISEACTGVPDFRGVSFFFVFYVSFFAGGGRGAGGGGRGRGGGRGGRRGEVGVGVEGAGGGGACPGVVLGHQGATTSKASDTQQVRA
jgi:hypothetical protein